MRGFVRFGNDEPAGEMARTSDGLSYTEAASDQSIDVTLKNADVDVGKRLSAISVGSNSIQSKIR